MDGKTILVVDDEPVWLNILSKFFGHYGYAVLTASTSIQAAELLRRHRPDCLLLDYVLADGDAGELCVLVRSDAALCGIPIVIFTGDPEAETCLEGPYRADRLFFKGEALPHLLLLVVSLIRGDHRDKPLSG
ncbi:MAG: response regulator [Elusimicrobia bacterium]|nr:response regulator [Elusimicrobiota bacterium]